MGPSEEGLVATGSRSTFQRIFRWARPDLPEGWRVHHSILREYQPLFDFDITEDVQFMRGVSDENHKVIHAIWDQWEAAGGGPPSAAQVADFAKFIDEMFIEEFMGPSF